VHNDVGGSSNYAYLNLQSGLNLGGRLRDNTTWSYSSGANNENQWQHINTWLERISRRYARV
jgi:outer membrane usher protein